MTKSKKIRLFVYGTLKDGSGINSFVHGDVWDLGSFPGAWNVGKSGAKVFGEIHEVDEDGLCRLDGYEGVAHGFYTRIETEAFDLEDNSLGTVWIYEFGRNPDEKFGATRLPNGVWNSNPLPRKW